MSSPFGDLQTLLRLAAEHPHLAPNRSQIPSSNGHGNHLHSSKTFTPNFDVHENTNEYVLEGEFPGLHDKSKTIIEFTDSRTLLIRGRVERSTIDVEKRPGSPKSLTATVEDVEDEEEKKEKEKKERETAIKKAALKCWVSERTVGEFQRSFTFPSSIDAEKVKATLEHGVLRIVVPKVGKVGPKRIQID